MDNTVGEQIRKFRKRAGKSQLDLELDIGASPGSISRIESGQVNPTKETLRKIIDVLDLKAKDAGILYDIDFEELPKAVALAKKISSSLDLDHILQTVVNDIVFDLDLLGSILFLCDSSNLYAKTITQTGYTKLVNNLLGMPVSSLKTSMNSNKENLVVRSVLERKTFSGNLLTEFSKNVIPDKLSNLIQKVTATKSIITFPIVLDDKVLGVILFTKSEEGGFDTEYDILDSFTGFISITLANAMKYREFEQKINLYESLQHG